MAAGQLVGNGNAATRAAKPRSNSGSEDTVRPADSRRSSENRNGGIGFSPGAFPSSNNHGAPQSPQFSGSRPGLTGPSFLDNQFVPLSAGSPAIFVEEASGEEAQIGNRESISKEPFLVPQAPATSQGEVSDSFVTIVPVSDMGHTAHVEWELSVNGEPEEITEEKSERAVVEEKNTALQRLSSWLLKQPLTRRLIPPSPGPKPSGSWPTGFSGKAEAETKLVESIGNKLRAALQTSAIEEKDYLPLDALCRIINRTATRKILKETFPNHAPKKIDKLLSKILGEWDPSGNQVQPPRRRKILAALVIMCEVPLIRTFIRNDIDDAALPLCVQRNTHSRPAVRLFSNTQGAPGCFHGWNARQAQLFYQTQDYVATPFFKFPGEEVSFYRFGKKIVMPFVEYHTPKRGGYGTVRKVKIHCAHHTYCASGKAQKGRDQYFAIKELNVDDGETYRREIELFERLGMCKTTHEHLIQLQLTYQHGSSYYLVFPWADGNLREYWRWREASPRDPRHATWLFKQCFGIARGLRRIHHLGTMSKTGLGDDLGDDLGEDIMSGLLYDSKQWGRHGDIKPENILWFEEFEGQPDYLVISDFGLTEFNTAQSRSRVVQKGIKGFSGTYIPPEFELDEDIGQRYDVWSLGCVFLEFVSWFLLGNKQTQGEFCDARLGTGQSWGGLSKDRFFGLIQDPRGLHYRSRAEVKGPVIAWIEKLHRQETCSQPIHEFLDLIQFPMLVPDPKARWGCDGIRRELRDLYGKCGSDPAYAATGCLGAPDGSRFPPATPITADAGLSAPDQLGLAALKNSHGLTPPRRPAVLDTGPPNETPPKIPWPRGQADITNMTPDLLNETNGHGSSLADAGSEGPATPTLSNPRRSNPGAGVRTGIGDGGMPELSLKTTLSTIPDSQETKSILHTPDTAPCTPTPDTAPCTPAPGEEEDIELPGGSSQDSGADKRC